MSNNNNNNQQQEQQNLPPIAAAPIQSKSIKKTDPTNAQKRFRLSNFNGDTENLI